jgi:5-methyltetrahydropteroyltriglutamate--homocysteine methyltransferase
VTGPVSRRHPVEVSDLEFLKGHASAGKQIKITVPGPFTMAQQAQDDHYGSREALAQAYAEVVNEEVRDLFAAGADIVQLDEPWLQARSEEASKYGVSVVNRALAGIEGTTAVHLCFGYPAMVQERPSGYSFLPELAECSCDQVSVETAQSRLDTSVLAGLASAGKTIILGVLDLSTSEVETPEVVAKRVRRTLPHVPASQLVLAPDCGMKYLPQASAFGKLTALTAAAGIVRAEIGG